MRSSSWSHVGGFSRRRWLTLFGIVLFLTIWICHTVWIAHYARDDATTALKGHRKGMKIDGLKAKGERQKLKELIRLAKEGRLMQTDSPEDAERIKNESSSSTSTKASSEGRSGLKKRANGKQTTKLASSKGQKDSAPGIHVESVKGASPTNAVLASSTQQSSVAVVSAESKLPYYDASGNFAPVAYLLIISNEEFLDGALVLGVSLRRNCPRLQLGTADLAIIITQDRVSAPSQMRLREEGGFNKIFEVPSLAKRAPNAYWKDTFDKIYMFNLTQYKKIVFMDADMINVRSMDVLFDKDFGDPTFVGAIGFRGGSEGPYFQTGMMVIQPTRMMFDRIYARFESGVPPMGNMYNHGMNGRDGVLLRDVFGNNFKILDNKFSRNLNPRYPVPEYVVSLHLRGKVKPWFDRRLPNLDPELGKKEFGHPYVLFWDVYENEVHKNSKFYTLAKQGLPLTEPFGGKFAAPDVSPLTHVWMMRYSSKEYVQLLSEEDRRRRNQTLPGLTHLTGHFNESCSEVCKKRQLNCSHEALFFSAPQECTFLNRSFEGKCDACEAGVYWRPHPGSDYPSLDYFKKRNICKFNLLFDDRGRPNCTARYEHAKRLCPCVPLATSRG